MQAARKKKEENSINIDGLWKPQEVCIGGMERCKITTRKLHKSSHLNWV